MVKADNMTPEEAKAHLAEMQRRARDRQRTFQREKISAGYRRVNAYVSPEAFAVLEEERVRSQENTGEILSRILLDHHKRISAPRDKKAVAPVTEAKAQTKTTAKPYDKEAVNRRIAQLSEAGMTPASIAKQLEFEEFLTPAGNTKWHRANIGRIIKQMEK